MSKRKAPSYLILMVDKNDEIIYDSQNRPTIYRSTNKLKSYLYKYKDTDKIVWYNRCGTPDTIKISEYKEYYNEDN